jgi:hydrogenase nickel incorporation protein HypA/HybF
MHEMTIASSLVELACEQAAKVGAVRVAEINIRMGVLCGIARSLYFCFGPATRGTLCEDAVLRIEEVPLTVMCTHCDQIKRPTALYSFRCPDCGRPTPKVVTGREMELQSLGLVPPTDREVEPEKAASPKRRAGSQKRSTRAPATTN